MGDIFWNLPCIAPFAFGLYLPCNLLRQVKREMDEGQTKGWDAIFSVALALGLGLICLGFFCWWLPREIISVDMYAIQGNWLGVFFVWLIGVYFSIFMGIGIIEEINKVADDMPTVLKKMRIILAVVVMFASARVLCRVDNLGEDVSSFFSFLLILSVVYLIWVKAKDCFKKMQQEAKRQKIVKMIENGRMREVGDDDLKFALNITKEEEIRAIRTKDIDRRREEARTHRKGWRKKEEEILKRLIAYYDDEGDIEGIPDEDLELATGVKSKQDALERKKERRAILDILDLYNKELKKPQ